MGWLDKLKQLVESKAVQPVDPALDQTHIFEQTTRMLKALAVRRPLVLVLGDLQWADSASISLFVLAQETRDPASLLMAYHALGESQGEMGDIVTARDTLETGLAYIYGEEHSISSRLDLAFGTLVLGYPDRMLAHRRQSLSLTEALAHPHVLAYTLYAISLFHLIRRDSWP